MNETFTVGRALSLGFRIWIKNFIPFALLTLLVMSPEILYLYSRMSGLGSDDSPYAIVATLVVFMLLGFGCSVLVISTFAYGVVMELKGEHAGMGATLAKGFSRFFPVLGVALLLGLLLIAILFGVALVAGRMGFAGQLIIWAVVGAVYAKYFVAIPAAVIERPGVTGALGRSRDLTEGRRGAIFGLLAVVFGMKQGVTLIAQEVLVNPRQDFAETVKTVLWTLVIIDIVFSMLTAVLASVTYYLLRNEKEGTSAEELAAVFE